MAENRFEKYRTKQGAGTAPKRENRFKKYVAPKEQPVEQPQAQGPQGDPSRWGMFAEAMDTVTMGGQSKINAAGGGLIDATIGALKGEGWDYSGNYNRALEQQRADQAAYQEQNPVKAGVGTAAGIGLGVTSLPAIGRGFKGAVATGAAYGGGAGAIRDADSWQERLGNTAKGAGIGGLLGGTVYGTVKGAGALIGKKGAPAPTAQEWKEKSSKLYSDAEGGFGANTLAVDDVLKLADDFEAVANKTAQSSPFAPIANKPYQETMGTVQKFREIAADIASGNQQPGTYANLEQLRQSLRARVDDMVLPNGKVSQDGRLMGRLLDAVDNMLLNSPFEEARAAYATTLKAERIAKAFRQAELNAGPNFSQAGMERAIRGEFKKIASKPDFARIYTSEEQKLIEQVVKGGPMQNLMMRFGALAPKGGLSTMFNIGLTATNPLIGIPVGIGAVGARMGSTAKTLRTARQVDEMVRRQGILGPDNLQAVDAASKVLLPGLGLLGDAKLRQRRQYGGPR